MQNRLLIVIYFIIVLTSNILEAKNYLSNPEVKTFIDDLVSKDKLERYELEKLFSNVEYQQTALSFYNKTIKPLPQKCTTKGGGDICRAEGSWNRYSFKILKFTHVQKGKAYMRKHKKRLNSAYKKYGVPPEYITAIIGIESFYGKNMGKYPIFDTLVTLSFEENRRDKFFKEELRAFLIMAHKEKRDPKKFKGSHAGAMGLGQFMPTNYYKVAIDFDKDGKIDLNDHDDAIGSIAKYLKESGWKRAVEVAIPVSFLGHRYRDKKTGFRYKYSQKELKRLHPKRATRYRGPVYLIKLDRGNYDELWFGTTNFYAITRYNHSDYYAMAVHQLAQKIMGRSVSQPSNRRKNIFGDTVIEYNELDNFLDSPMKKRKFIIDI
ncbi:Membrane-bound lytic murein transglycosylase B precursor [hydrothermal vent metagenome]|uniref:Membrane-bound lytic murein transglycosylase B n=1 Tax=hydrothermal vent metagenome TaxID=652676 RepID=A0A1W1B8D2_9ZZZZ